MDSELKITCPVCSGESTISFSEGENKTTTTGYNTTFSIYGNVCGHIKELMGRGEMWTVDTTKYVPSDNPNETKNKISSLLDNFKEFLIEKNNRYGDAALHPQKIFNKSDAEDSICVRLDDKLNRIINSSELQKNDVSDCFGYLALLMIQNGWTDFEDLLD